MKVRNEVRTIRNISRNATMRTIPFAALTFVGLFVSGIHLPILALAGTTALADQSNSANTQGTSNPTSSATASTGQPDVQIIVPDPTDPANTSLTSDPKISSATKEKFFDKTWTSIKSLTDKSIRLGIEKGMDPKFDIDLLQLTNFSSALSFEMKPVAASTIEWDVQKLEYDTLNGKFLKSQGWYDITLGTKIYIPYYVSFPELAYTFGATVGGETYSKMSWRLRLRSKDVFEPTDKLMGLALNETRNRLGAIRSIRIPMTPDGLVAKFAPGTEIETSGYMSILGKISLSEGVPVLSISASVYALLSGQLTRVIKIIDVDGKKLVNLRIEKTGTAGSEVSSSLNAGITVFETETLKGVLSASLLSASKSFELTDSLDLNYTYDISYPEAKAALASALLGSFTKTQELTTLAGKSAKYKGVLNEYRIHTLSKEDTTYLSLGVHSDSSALSTVDSFSVSMGDFVGNLLSSTWKGVRGFESKLSTNAYGDQTKSESFSWKDTETFSLLWGLLGKFEKAVSVTSRQLDFGADHSSALPIEKEESLNYSFSYKITKGRFDITDYFQHELDFQTEGSVNTTLATCGTKDVALILGGSFYQESLDYLSTIQESDIWKTFLEYKNYPEFKIKNQTDASAALVSLAKRHTKFEKARDMLGSNISPKNVKAFLVQNFPGEFENQNEVELQIVIQAQLKAIQYTTGDISKFNTFFIPGWNLIRKTGSLNDKHRLYRELFAKYKGDPTPFSILSLLAKTGKYSNDRGMYYEISAKSPNCNVKWSTIY